MMGSAMYGKTLVVPMENTASNPSVNCSCSTLVQSSGSISPNKTPSGLTKEAHSGHDGGMSRPA